MKVYEELMEKIREGKKLLFPVVDPLDHEEGNLERVADEAEKYADAIIVGGSIGVQGEVLDNTIDEIKKRCTKPIILFPGNIGTISKKADAIYFLSLINSTNPYWITKVQMLSAPVIKRMGLEAISVAYFVVEPGGTVGFVGDVIPLPRNKPEIMVAYSLYAEIIGYKFILFDSGSNAPSPLPTESIKVISNYITIPFGIAGGIKTPEQAREIVKAGASFIHIGTVFEKKPETMKLFRKAIDEI